MPFRLECSAWERWPLQYGEWLSTWILVAVTSVLSPVPTTPDLPQASLVHSTLPLLVPRVSGFKQNFVLWSFKRLSESLSLPGRLKPCCFSQLGVIWVPFRLWCYMLGIPSWGLYPMLLRGNPAATEVFLQNLSYCLWEPSQPFHSSSALPISFVVVKWFLLSVCGYKASLQFLFSWLCRMFFL